MSDDEQLMLEYIFFHQEPCERFKQFLHSVEVEPLKEGIDQTDVEGLVVCIQDNLDDDLSERIEAFYDEMMDLDEALVSADSADDEVHQVGLAVSLSDGRSVLASVNPDTLNRILSVISQQQLGDFVDAIADAVENPDERPLCKR